jgi:Holliday junction resolvase-like predicted endonuclease
MKEAQIKTKCTKFLESKGWEVVHLITTNKPGIPDTLAMKNGQIFFIEFKQPGKKPRPLQEYRQMRITQNGFIVTNIQTIEQLEKFINDL